MSLYQTGTCNMTNNSAAVVGVGTAFVANVTAGDGFLISGETVYYTVLSVTDDTHLTLSVVYAGVTGNGKTYQISRDWTTNLGLAEIQPGDPNWPYLLVQKVIRKIDGGIATAATVTNTPAGGIAATNVQAAINELDTEKAPKESPVFTTKLKILSVGGSVSPGIELMQADAPTYGFTWRRDDTTGNLVAARVELGVSNDYMTVARATGNVGIGMTPTARNNTRLQIVDGIGFPAAQVPSTDPNTLDDYEEGTWTPVLGDGTNNYSIVPTPQTRYTKIGRLVTCFAFVSWDSIGSAGSSSWRIGGLPFAIENLSGYPAVTFGEVGGVDNLGGKQLIGRGQVDTTYLQASVVNDNASPTALAANAQSATGYLVVSITYNT